MERKTIAPGYANRLINNGPVVLVTCGRDPHNIITVAWITSVSSTPPLLAIAIGKARYSRQLIDESGEFVVNVPPASLLDSVWKCGTISGRDADKFRAAWEQEFAPALRNLREALVQAGVAVAKYRDNIEMATR